MTQPTAATILHPVRFDATGMALPDQRDVLAARLATAQMQGGAPPRLLVLCHGWLTTGDAALSLYRNMLSAHPALMRGLLVAGVQWPSLPFADTAEPSQHTVIINDLKHLEKQEVADGDNLDLPPLAPPWEGRMPASSSPAAGMLWSVAGRVAGGFSPASLINYLSYRVMKNRAGVIGRDGIARWLASLPNGIELHLVGHSFGARALCAAVMAGKPGRVSSLTLLQGALSHGAFGLAGGGAPEGYFRPLISQHLVSGPVIVTHTHADRAVTTAYAIASHLLRQDAARLGKAGDRFGGMGANGALRLAPGELSDTVTRLLGPDRCHGFADGMVHNLRADGWISGHGDICNPAIGALLAEVVLGSRASGAQAKNGTFQQPGAL